MKEVDADARIGRPLEEHGDVAGVDERGGAVLVEHLIQLAAVPQVGPWDEDCAELVVRRQVIEPPARIGLSQENHLPVVVEAGSLHLC